MEMIVRADGVTEQQLDGEVLLLLDGEVDVLHLNVVATALWHQLTPAVQLSDAASAIAADFDVPAEQVLDDLRPVVDLLVERGVVHRETR